MIDDNLNDDLISALAKALETHLQPTELPSAEALADFEGVEKDRELVRLTLPSIAGRASSPQLTPIETELFRVPDNGLGAMVDEFDLNAEQQGRWKKADDHFDRVRLVRRWLEQDSEKRGPVVDKYIYSARTTVNPYKLDHPVSEDELFGAIQKATGLDLSNGGVLAEVNNTPQPSHSRTLSDGRIAITYQRASDAQRQVLNAERHLVNPSELKMVTFLVDPTDGTIDVRGQAGDIKATFEQFKHDLRRGGLAAQVEKVPLDGVSFAKLKSALKAKVVRERSEDPNGKQTGGGVLTLSLAKDYAGSEQDLVATEAYQKQLADRRLTLWNLVFPFGDREFSLQFNIIGGYLTFPHGNVPEEAIKFVLTSIHAMQNNNG